MKKGQKVIAAMVCVSLLPAALSGCTAKVGEHRRIIRVGIIRRQIIRPILH